jgi:polar amino acid transport system substrate-binding protein/glutamate/aspartate transport system substrate-binding protein
MFPAAPAILLAALLAAPLGPAAPAAGGTLDRLREGAELRLGHRVDALPLSFVNDAGMPAGYTVAVCEAVAEALRLALGLEELTLVFVPVETEDRFAAVAAGEVDLLCGADSVTLGRREIVDFSIPVFVDGAAVLTLAAAPPTLASLAGGRIGLREGTTAEAALADGLAALAAGAEIVGFDSHQAGRDALMAGEIDGYFGDRSILIGLILTSGVPETFALSDDMLTIEKHALALPRGDADFRLAIDRALSGLYRSGAMDAMLRAAMPGVKPGLALQALFLIAPEPE